MFQTGNPVLEPGTKLRFQMPLPENMEELVEVIQGAEAASAAAKLAEVEADDAYASDEPADRLAEGPESSGRAVEDGGRELGFRVIQHDAPGRPFVTTFR